MVAPAEAGKKAPGPDGIPNEPWRDFPVQAGGWFWALCLRISLVRKEPLQFKRALVCALHKKGPAALPENYRSIALLNGMAKIWHGRVHRIVGQSVLGRYDPLQLGGPFSAVLFVDIQAAYYEDLLDMSPPEKLIHYGDLVGRMQGYEGDVVELPNGTLWMYYFGGGLEGVPRPGIRMQIGLATSEDGLSWRRHGAPVLTPGAPGDFDETFVAWPRVLPPWDTAKVTGIPEGKWQPVTEGAAFSDDGVSWTKDRAAHYAVCSTLLLRSVVSTVAVCDDDDTDDNSDDDAEFYNGDQDRTMMLMMTTMMMTVFAPAMMAITLAIFRSQQCPR
ncbi:hypothetical protein AK812_SmicGene4611 [Symbiodinium microadriaticum]|uniref:Glycosyl hydrolase family 32 N-terminal domain-containing protein n=1 Tax=Symbiodinium microadriaticum TaxID=2951 RepID=A0A1Q9EVV7_SYMMI|nr:hypothetical protein AK812_SmicGene4611 [Symbiodinium microadriaticum]